MFGEAIISDEGHFTASPALLGSPAMIGHTLDSTDDFGFGVKTTILAQIAQITAAQERSDPNQECRDGRK